MTLASSDQHEKILGMTVIEVDTTDRMERFAAGVGGKQLRYVNLITDNGESTVSMAI